MKTNKHSQTNCHDLSALPLFAFRRTVGRPATRAGLHLLRRYRLHPAVADVVAELAGLGERGVR